MPFRSIQFVHEANVARITLNRPPLNILDIGMMEEIGAAIEAARDAAVLVFRGAGPKAFSAGAAVSDHTPERVGTMLERFHAVFRQLHRFPGITVAAVHGHCLGGGCELAAFCDFVIASETAKFGQPEITLACFPPVAAVIFPPVIGFRRAKDLILTGRTISAREAEHWGLVNRVVAEGDLDRALEEFLAGVGKLSRPVIGLTKRAMLAAAGVDFEKALGEVERIYLEELMKTEDAREGIAAFLEKRYPVWKGR
ncbi:MAG TPA: enoyl-CoA hydratase-related protein [Candidatus Acidoferrales bacterium]